MKTPLWPRRIIIRSYFFTDCSGNPANSLAFPAEIGVSLTLISKRDAASRKFVGDVFVSVSKISYISKNFPTCIKTITFSPYASVASL